MCDIVVLSEAQVEQFLKWNKVISVVRQSLTAVTVERIKDDKKAGKYKDLKMRNPKRIFMDIPFNKGAMLTMPGFIEGFKVEGVKQTSLTCKILNISHSINRDTTSQKASITGYLYLFDEKSGKMEAVMGAERVTEWRTAAVSCVATELLWKKSAGQGEKYVLAIMGAGAQGRIHAIALQQQFHFDEIRIWNRTESRARQLVDELTKMNIARVIKFCNTGGECAQEADVIVTATTSVAVILQDDWVKAGAHINAVGVGENTELSLDIYKRSDVYVESRDLAKSEIPHIALTGELGELELNVIKRPESTEKITIFQSRGMGIHDSVVARLVFNMWKKKKANSASTSKI